MIDLWLHSGTAGIILIAFALLYVIAASIVWLTHLSPLRPFFLSCVGITGPFFASVAVLFGLFAAFLANDVQHRSVDLNTAVFREADGIRTILRLSEALGEAGRPVTAAAIGYTQTVLAKELPAMHERGSAREGLGAVRGLMLAVLAPATTAAATQQALIEGLLEVRQARLGRLTLSSGRRDHMNWLALLILGMLTQIAIAVVQLERLRPQALALFVFTTAFAATVVLIGLAEQRVSGEAVNDAPLRAALASAMP